MPVPPPVASAHVDASPFAAPTIPWPSGERAVRRWPGDPSALRRADRRPFDYTAIVAPEIRAVEIALDGQLAAAVEQASTAIASLNAHGSGRHLRHVAAALLRGEALASSRLEGITASHRRVAEVSLGAHRTASRDAREIHANIAAMRRVFEAFEPDERITTYRLREANLILLNGTRFDPDTGSVGGAGQLRDGAMWVGEHSSPDGADFVAAPAEDVPRLMADLEQFLTRTVMPAVVQAGIAHAQFETIHPFVDGNGRVGRGLIHAVLRHRALSVKVPVPISAALLADRDGYLAALTAYQQHADVRTWLMRFAEACTVAARHGQELGDRLEELDMSWRERDSAPRRGSHAHRLLDHLIAYPVLNADVAARLLDTDQRQARRALDRLEQAGVLTVSGGQRYRTWRAGGVLDLLDDFQDTISAG